MFSPKYMNRLFSKDNQYFALLLAHILLGCILYKYPKLGSYFGMLVAATGFFYVMLHKNKNHEVLQVAGYFIGSEVLLRMTSVSLSYEFMKCSLLMFGWLGDFL